MRVRAARGDEAALYARFACALWPDSSPEAHLAEGARLLSSPFDQIFFAESAEFPAGFAHVSLRFDYVEGAGEAPTGYLESIYVSPAFRRRGVARQLLRTSEAWARDQGAHAFASDCELNNLESQRFHEKMGFTEANRIVCYIKPIALPSK